MDPGKIAHRKHMQKAFTKRFWIVTCFFPELYEISDAVEAFSFMAACTSRPAGA